LLLDGLAVSNYMLEYFRIILILNVARKSLRTLNSRFLGSLGLVAGVFYADLSSTQRLMGIYPNEAEVARYGFYTKEQLEEYAKDDIPCGELVGRIPKEKEWKSL
jgi:hypothetical protein